MSKSLKLCENDVKFEFERNIEKDMNIMITNELFNKDYVKTSFHFDHIQSFSSSIFIDEKDNDA